MFEIPKDDLKLIYDGWALSDGMPMSKLLEKGDRIIYVQKISSQSGDRGKWGSKPTTTHPVPPYTKPSILLPPPNPFLPALKPTTTLSFTTLKGEVETWVVEIASYTTVGDIRNRAKDWRGVASGTVNLHLSGVAHALSMDKNEELAHFMKDKVVNVSLIGEMLPLTFRWTGTLRTFVLYFGLTDTIEDVKRAITEHTGTEDGTFTLAVASTSFLSDDDTAVSLSKACEDKQTHVTLYGPKKE